MEVVGGVWKSWVVCGSSRWRVEVIFVVFKSEVVHGSRGWCVEVVGVCESVGGV